MTTEALNLKQHVAPDLPAKSTKKISSYRGVVRVVTQALDERFFYRGVEIFRAPGRLWHKRDRWRALLFTAGTLAEIKKHIDGKLGSRATLMDHIPEEIREKSNGTKSETSWQKIKKVEHGPSGIVRVLFGDGDFRFFYKGREVLRHPDGSQYRRWLVGGLKTGISSDNLADIVKFIDG